MRYMIDYKSITSSRNVDNIDDADGNTALVLANAVYFKDQWEHQFHPFATSDHSFHIDTNTIKDVPTMYTEDYYKYIELPEYDATCFELPYMNKEVSMVIILSNKVDGLTALIQKLEEVSAECSNRLVQMYKRKVQLFLPKFRTETELDLKDTLSHKPTQPTISDTVNGYAIPIGKIGRA